MRSFEFLGEATRYQLQLNNGRNIEAMAREPLKIDMGDTVGVEVSVHKPIVF